MESEIAYNNVFLINRRCVSAAVAFTKKSL